MSETALRVDAPPVADHRPVPTGVLPRGMQTWVMLGVAVGMIAIILFAGRREPPARAVATAQPAAPNPERVRDYQERLRALDARAAQEARSAALPVVPASAPAVDDGPQVARATDPIVADRKRREYESLFASNVVLSRRPDAQRPDAGSTVSRSSAPSVLRDPAAPSIDAIADAAVRASARANGVVGQPAISAPAAPVPAAQRAPGPSGSGSVRRVTSTDPISDGGSLHRILEGTVVDTVLTNRLDGGSSSPVNCLVTNPVYSHSGQIVLIPAGARILGETKPVQALGETRLAVAFHRVLMPDGSTFSLDRFPGLNQIGDAGLRDQVNQHYLSTFGAAAAVGLISGLAQFVGTARLGVGEGNGNRTVIIAGGAAEGASQASVQTMNRFLNRLPTITIREGHRIKVYLTSDLELPAYRPAVVSDRF
jgi:type IV secretory pathway VirB10-like protein